MLDIKLLDSEMDSKMHDAIRHSTSHTTMREARDAWKKHLKFLREKTKSALIGGSREPTADEWKSLCLSAQGVAGHLIDIVEAIHWPLMDGANSQLTDEICWEIADRHLKTKYLTPEAGIVLSWSLIDQAIRRVTEWQRNEKYKAIGIDLSAYFSAELQATLNVVRKHHIDVASRVQ